MAEDPLKDPFKAASKDPLKDPLKAAATFDLGQWMVSAEWTQALAKDDLT